LSEASSAKAGRRRLALVGGAAVLVVVVALVLWGRFNRLPTVEPGEPLELPPADVEIVRADTGPQPSRVRETPPEPAVPRTATPTPKRLDSDADRLSLITSNWVYRGFAGVGDNKRGRFTHSAKGEVFFVNLGQVWEGVKVLDLDRLSAVAGLGSATILMPIVPEFPIDFQRMANPAIPSEAEVEAAQTRYWQQYGKRFNELGKRYTPRPGERMPPREPPSQEQAATAKARYIATMMPRFQQINAQRTPVPGEILPEPHPDVFDEQKAIENYYRRFRPYETPPTPAPK